MIITSLMPVTKQKTEVEIDGQFAFVLYRSCLVLNFGSRRRFRLRFTGRLQKKFFPGGQNCGQCIF